MTAFILFRISILISRYRIVIGITRGRRREIHSERERERVIEKKVQNFSITVDIVVLYFSVVSLLICHTLVFVVSLFIQRIVENCYCSRLVVVILQLFRLFICLVCNIKYPFIKDLTVTRE